MFIFQKFRIKNHVLFLKLKQTFVPGVFRDFDFACLELLCKHILGAEKLVQFYESSLDFLQIVETFFVFHEKNKIKADIFQNSIDDFCTEMVQGMDGCVQSGREEGILQQGGCAERGLLEQAREGVGRGDRWAVEIRQGIRGGGEPF